MSATHPSEATILRRRLGIAALVIAALAVSAAVLQAAPPARVVAVGDVHGSPEGLRSVLQLGGIVDLRGRWAAKDATLVQTGDVLDRGLAVRENLDLLIRLQAEAAAAGGEVVCLLGNHEAMNLLGRLRDVAPELVASFADERSGRRRSRAATRWVRCQHRLADLLGRAPAAPDHELRRQWLEATPPGALEYLRALAPDGRYGRWLRRLPAVAVRGDTLFVHGGLSPDLEAPDVAAVNRRVAGELAAFDAGRDALAAAGLVLPTAALAEVLEVARLVTAAAPAAAGRRGEALRRLAASVAGVAELERASITSRDGPLWYRGAALGDDDEVRAVLEVVRRLGAERLVIGHTSQDDGRIGVRAGGRVLLIDTGMLGGDFYPGGRPAALQLCGPAATAVYPDGRFVLDAGGTWRPAPVAEPTTAGGGRGPEVPARAQGLRTAH